MICSSNIIPEHITKRTENLYVYLYTNIHMRNTGLEEAQAGIKIAGRNINNLRWQPQMTTTFMAESEEELKSLLMKVKEESEKLA